MRGCSILLLALTGCGFHTVTSPRDFAGDDFSTEIPDFAFPPGSDLAGLDLTAPPGSDLSTRGGDMSSSEPACALPYLMVTVEHLSTLTGAGRVARLNLGDGSLAPTQCATLAAQGLMTQQPQSSAFTGGRVAVLGFDGLQLLDPAIDSIVFTKPLQMNDDFPVEVFPLTRPNGDLLVAAAWGTMLSPTTIARVDAWGLDGSMVSSWPTGNLTLGLDIIGMTRDPLAPTQLLACDVDNNTMAWAVDPWGGTKSSLVGSGIPMPLSIFADVEGTQTRIAWVDSTAPSAVYYYNSAEGTGLFGPIRCANCTLLHAVPDPTDNLRFFGLCDGNTVDSRRVVRFSSSGGTCDTVLEGALFPSDRMSRLSVAQ
jgi:hypothetical protein